MSNISASAKADTHFGPLGGRTAVHVTNQGMDSVVITFQCGPTPVVLAMAGANFHEFARQVVAQANQLKAAEYGRNLRAVSS